jgi:hypothetical protein
MWHSRRRRKILCNFPCRPICYLCEGQIKTECFGVSIETASINYCVHFDSQLCVCLHNYMVSCTCTSQSWHSIIVIMTILPARWCTVWTLGGKNLDWLWGPPSLRINGVLSQQKSGWGTKLTTCPQTVPWPKMSRVTPLLLLCLFRMWTDAVFLFCLNFIYYNSLWH